MFLPVVVSLGLKCSLVEELDALVSQAARLANSVDHYDELIEANTRLHLCLAKMSCNGEFVKLMTSILERNARVMYLELRSSRFRWTDFEQMHRPIVDAIRAQ